MFRYIYRKLNPKYKSRIRHYYYKLDRMLTDLFFSYEIEELKAALSTLGIKQGDTLLLHSSFTRFNGFKGNPNDVMKCLIEILGKEGNLLMVSLPSFSSSYDYLMKNQVFDVRKTMSKMGIISELFRRTSGVLRSLHPTHPVLAYGKDASWIVEGHHNCLFPCGKGTPFDKFRQLKGKILFFDVPFGVFTFFHYIEDLIKDELPFQLYTQEPFAAKVLDYEGNEIIVNTYAFSDFTIKRRNPDVLRETLLNRKFLKRRRVGKTTLMLVSAESAVQCTRDLLDENIYFYNGVVTG